MEKKHVKDEQVKFNYCRRFWACRSNKIKNKKTKYDLFMIYIMKYFQDFLKILGLFSGQH